jgi:hypothetical protein
MRKGSGHSKQEGNEPRTTSSTFLLESHLSGGVGKGVKIFLSGHLVEKPRGQEYVIEATGPLSSLEHRYLTLSLYYQWKKHT